MRGEEILAVGGVITRADEVQVNIGIDVAAARGKGVGLVLTEGGMQRFKLAIQVCGAYGVIVDERQLADARAHQRLDRVAADTAKAEHGHVAVLQPLHGRIAEKHLRA